MIRIDLGKGEVEKGTPGGGEKKTKKFSFDFKSQLPIQALLENPKFKQLTGDVRGLVYIGVALAFSFLPHIFFSQYRAFVEKQHQLRVKRLKENIEVINAEIAKLTPFKKELESYESQKKAVQDRLEVIRQLLTSRGTPVNVLDAVGQSLPPRAWISNLDLAVTAQARQVGVTGQAFGNEDISDFVDKLSESTYLEDVKLLGVSTFRGPDRLDLRSFSITTRPKGKAIVVVAPAGKGDPKAEAARAPAKKEKE